MRRPPAVVLLLTLGLAGCSAHRGDVATESVTPFVFQQLNLRQQDPQGRLLWRVSSPEARYDLSRRIAQSWSLSGEIWTNGQPLYRLQADHGTVLADGQVVQMEGDVRVQRLGGDPVTIRAARMRWYPRAQRLELDRHAEAQTPQLRLLASTATLYLDRDRLELRGQPELQNKELRLRLKDLSWSPGSGELWTSGPAVATGLGSGGVTRTLRAAGLRGNTIGRTLLLQQPVEFNAPDQQAWLRAQSSLVDLSQNTVVSSLPFEARVKTLAIQGGAFRLDLDAQAALITRRCRLQQPNASLVAGACRWDWRTQQIQASRGVEVRRGSNQQLTKANSLNGSLAGDGQFSFRAPGDRVQSRWRLPAARQQSSPMSRAIRL